MPHDDDYFLRLAIQLAQQGRAAGADPFGAVLVGPDGVIAAQDFDRSVARSDPTAHAELAVISAYCRAQHVFDLSGYTLYSSAEPCVMCSGAIHWAR
ncbi:MAG: nucleoside deaminase, partial [Anaerolineae bacterium]|nr:nucleoside deaminase [Anaerolineae bacterium]